MAEKADGEMEGEPSDAEGGADESAEAPSGNVASVDLPFPGYVATAFCRLHQTSFPRRWCLTVISWPYLFTYMYTVKGIFTHRMQKNVRYSSNQTHVKLELFRTFTVK